MYFRIRSLVNYFLERKTIRPCKYSQPPSPQFFGYFILVFSARLNSYALGSDITIKMHRHVARTRPQMKENERKHMVRLYARNTYVTEAAENGGGLATILSCTIILWQLYRKSLSVLLKKQRHNKKSIVVFCTCIGHLQLGKI